MDQLLKQPDKGAKKTAGTNGVLSRLWRTLLCLHEIEEKKWSRILDNYVSDPKNNIPNTKKDRISARGNITREFAKPQMTWKVFIKALRFLGVAKIEIVLNITHVNGKQVTIKEPIQLARSLGVDEQGKVIYVLPPDPEQPESSEFVPIVSFLDELIGPSTDYDNEVLREVHEPNATSEKLKEVTTK